MDWSKEKNYFLAAMMFFTRFPVSTLTPTTPYSDKILYHSRKYFPFIGVLIGCLAALIIYLSNLVLPLILAIVLSILATVLATGAFHEDGFADCCDGFGGGWSKEEILTIMKDSRVGTYGVVGLVLLFSLKIFTLYELGNTSLSLLLACCVNGHALSRLGASLSAEKLDYVQNIDKSKIKPIANKSLSTKSLIFSASLTAPSILFLLTFDSIYIFAAIPMLSIFILGNRYFKKHIGGYTGDCLGAMQQTLEVVFYLSILILNTI